jgi:outer membrane protein
LKILLPGRNSALINYFYPKMKYLFRILACILVTVAGASAQDLLTLEQAIKTALENNYSIRLVANDLKIDKNNVTIGNAGFLPAVTGNLSDNNSIQSGTISRNNTTTELRNSLNSTLTYGVGLTWTVFDGFAMFARYDQLKEFEKLGEQEMQKAVLATVGDVISAYYDLAQQQLQLNALDTAIEISRERVRNAQNRFEVGRAAKLEVLNAQVDLNTDTTAMLRQKDLYARTQILLNQLLARDPGIRFRVDENFSVDTTLQLSQLSDIAGKQNPDLQAAVVNKRIAELELKQVRAGKYPFLRLNSGYNFNYAASTFGVVPGQTTGRGINYGVTAGINIFNGFNQRRTESNAKILIENAQLQQEQLSLAINAQLAAAWQNYQTSLTLAGLENRNQDVAKQNLDITMEKYRLGKVAPLEIREAQLNYVNATVRYTNAQYQSKLAEVALREIAGGYQLVGISY